MCQPRSTGNQEEKAHEGNAMKFSKAVVACTATAAVAVTASATIPALAANGPTAGLTGTPSIV
jgi:hypothetical protein